MTVPFAHLHVHTQFSLLDGYSDVQGLIQHVSDLSMTAVAITDHGTLAGAIDFHKAAKSAGVTPIIGMEGYITYDMNNRETRHSNHILFLAKNNRGYENLIALSSQAHTDGFYYRPRMDWNLLNQYKDDLIVTSGCLAGEVAQHYLRAHDKPEEIKRWNEVERQFIRKTLGGQILRDIDGDTNYEIHMALAERMFEHYFEVFGDNFYAELQYRKNSVDQLEYNRWLLAMARNYGVKPVLTTDSHYTTVNDAIPHDLLLCVQTGAQVNQTDRMRFDENTYYIADYDTLKQWVVSEYSEEDLDMLHNTMRIVEDVNIDLSYGGYKIPEYPDIPKLVTADRHLKNLSLRGLKELGYTGDVYIERIEYELSVIKDMKFADYFLIVKDICDFARDNDIWWNVRGSGAGSLVANCLGITSLDPIQHDLIFERFLNPSRVNMPDIDIDFEDTRRGEVVGYIIRKYGVNHVAAIGTHGYMGAKMTVRDLGRAFGVPLDIVNRIASLVKDEYTTDENVEFIRSIKEGEQIAEYFPEIRKTIRNQGQHAAGYIITPKDLPLDKITPLVKAKKYNEEGLKGSTQFPMKTIDDMGLLKVDLLGLSSLSHMKACCERIYERHGVRYSINDIPYYHHDGVDETSLNVAFDLISSGKTAGIFQIEKLDFASFLTELRPFRFEHVVASLALYRPGPMGIGAHYSFAKRLHGEEEIVYRHESLEPILKETMGLIIFQEQIQRIASEICGYTLGEADYIRKAVAKKDGLDKHHDKFVRGAVDNGLPSEVAQRIWDDIVYFANYGFNKCLTGDTVIYDSETGSRYTIEEIVSGKIELSVHTLNDSLKIETRKVIDWFENGVKPVYTLILRSGKTIKATENHPFRTQFGWTNLSNIAVGELIAVPRSLDFDNGSTREISNLAHSDIYWDEVVSIEYFGNEMTYDITVDGTHNFVANDIFVHNSHSADYAKLTVQTAWLKAHYPMEFMETLLDSSTGDQSRAIYDCRLMNIPVYPVNVNRSGAHMRIHNDGIAYSMSKVLHVGERVASSIENERDENGEYTSLSSFIHRVGLSKDTLNKTALVNLVKCGALDDILERDGLSRNSVIDSIDTIMKTAKKTTQKIPSGQFTLFDVSGTEQEHDDVIHFDIPYIPDNDAINLQWERELTGFYLTGRPTDRHIEYLSKQYVTEIEYVSEDHIGNNMTVAGRITASREHLDKKQNKMMFLEIECYGAAAKSMSLVIFSSTFKKLEFIPRDDDIVIVSGRIDTNRNGDLNMLVDTILLLERLDAIIK